MRLLHLAVFCLLLVTCLTASAEPAFAVTNRYTDDFTTTRCRDPVNTTALWDTVAGELRLPPFEVTIEGSYDSPGAAIGAAIDGDYAYVADYGSGLQVINITDPASPTLAGSYDTPGQALEVAISGNYAYVADYTPGLEVIDITDPASPTLVGMYITSEARGVEISGDYAYVACGGSGLQVLDITDPESPTFAGSYNTLGYSYAVAISGDYAYVADGGSGLQVIDISDPASPTLAGGYATPGVARDVTVSGDYAYVADYSSGLQVIDISDPTGPALGGSYDTPGYAYGVAVEGDYAYVGDYYNLQVIDISDPTGPTLADSCDTPGEARGVSVSGNHAYVGDYGSGLQVMLISRFQSPRYSGSWGPAEGAIQVAIHGDHAFVADYEDGLQVIDIINPASPTVAGSYPGHAYGVAVSGDCAYVASDDSVLVIDIANPASPTFAGGCPLPAAYSSVVVSGDYAYVCVPYEAPRCRLKVIDVSDPVNPTVVGSYSGDLYDTYWGLAISGDYAYLVGWYQEVYPDLVYRGFLEVVSIANPTSPSRVFYGMLDWDTKAYGVVASGGNLFIACQYFPGSGGVLYVLDIHDPDQPVNRSSCCVPGRAYNVAVSGDYAFVADEGYGLQAISIANLASPALAGYYNTPDLAFGVAISGDHAYVADGSSLQVLKVAQRQYDAGNRVGRSVSIDDSDDLISAVRLSSVQTGSIGWEVSADGGTNWMSIAPNNIWQSVSAVGLDLLWRSTHSYLGDGINPTCSGLTIEWLCTIPAVDDVSDVTNDQGRQVRIGWSRNGYDAPGVSPRVTEYAIFRKVDGASASSGTRGDNGPKADTQTEEGADLAAYPPGNWDFVKTVPADCEESYWTVAPTLADSTADAGIVYTAFFVRARTVTPSVYYDSPVDSGYSVDNLVPALPGELMVRSGPFPTREGSDGQNVAGVGGIGDVSNDQGRQVQIVWARDSRDSAGSSSPIIEYSIFRRIDDLSAPPMLTVGSKPAAGYLSYPAGEWDFVTTVPANCESTYSTVIPTLADSTAAEGIVYSAFFVRARTATPGVYYDAPVDSGYSVDNLAPAPPGYLRMTSATALAWDESEDADFDYFTVYGSDSPWPDTSTVFIGHTIGASMGVTGDVFKYYHVAVSDFSGNEGDASSVENSYSGASAGEDLPTVFALKPSRPNPFSVNTVIGFDLPVACAVSLKIFDTQGRQVRSLVDRAYAAGRHSIIWTGDSDAGRPLGSGIYFVRIEAGNFRAVLKVLLTR